LEGWASSTGAVEQRGIQGFGGELEGKRPRGSPRHRQEYNIKMFLK